MCIQVVRKNLNPDAMLLLRFRRALLRNPNLPSPNRSASPWSNIEGLLVPFSTITGHPTSQQQSAASVDGSIIPVLAIHHALVKPEAPLQASSSSNSAKRAKKGTRKREIGVSSETSHKSKTKHKCENKLHCNTSASCCDESSLHKINRKSRSKSSCVTPALGQNPQCNNSDTASEFSHTSLGNESTRVTTIFGEKSDSSHTYTVSQFSDTSLGKEAKRESAGVLCYKCFENKFEEAEMVSASGNAELESARDGASEVCELDTVKDDASDDTLAAPALSKVTKKCIVALKTRKLTKRENTASRDACKNSAAVSKWEETAFKLLIYGVPSVSVNKMLEKCTNLIVFMSRVDPVYQCFRSIGMLEEEIGHVISQWPTILNTSESMLECKIQFFEHIGIDRIALGRIISFTHTAITRPIANLERLAGFWEGYIQGMKDMTVGSLITKNPRLMMYSLEKSVKPKIAYLEELGFDKRMVCKHTSILGCSMDAINSKVNMLKGFGLTEPRSLAVGLSALHSINKISLHSRFDNLIRLGFSKDQVQRIICLNPKLLSLREERVNQKVAYAVDVMKVHLDDLAKCYSFWSCSLDNRIRPRNEILVKLKEKGAIDREPSLSYLLQMNDERFQRRFERKLADCS